MNDDQFRQLCNTFGFAPSRALRELVDAAIGQVTITHRSTLAEALKLADSMLANTQEKK